MNAICPICGKTFEKTSPASRYCSTHCRVKARDMRDKVRETVKDMPKEAFDLFDAFSRLRYVESDFARLAASAEPRTRAIALRVSEGIAAIIDAEGML